jgi:hypothetical protein
VQETENCVRDVKIENPAGACLFEKSLFAEGFIYSFLEPD